ncbi:MAG: hypothetical protein FJX95_06785, partial [Bacteroidetes bacterium]|nr:hypothetical protein [Bacteroidota bacterium]
MRKYVITAACLILVFFIVGFSDRFTMKYNGASVEGSVAKDKNGLTLETRFQEPNGYKRIEQTGNSFGSFLRKFPLLPDGSPVELYNGVIKSNPVHEAVFDLSVGNRDLQQCADAVMRMRGEYLYAQNRKSEIHFHLTNGFDMSYSKWMQGYRLQVNGNKTQWVKSHAPGDSHEIFMKYMEVVFNYAGTLSLSKELKPKSIQEIMPGDVWIYGGSPGHAVLVVDVASNARGEKVFMVAQSYMPAQQMHLLKNENQPQLSPWYKAEKAPLETPEWT